MIKLKIGTFQRPAHGEKICGDAFVVIPHESSTIIALADGLGHGLKAAEAAQAFCDYVNKSYKRRPEDILLGAHRHIRHTRGVVASIIRIDTNLNQIEYAGVGNVELQALSLNPIKPVSIPGIIGNRVRKVKSFSYDLAIGDLFVLFTDGISNRFLIEEYAHLDVQDMAENLLCSHERNHDDRTCIVVHCQ